MGFFDQLKEKGALAVEKGKEYAEITKLNVEISSYEDEIREQMIVVGGIVYEKGLPITEENTDIAESIAKIRENKEKILEIQAKIDGIKNTTNETDEKEEV